MPELPEIEAYLHALRPRVVGHELEHLRINSFSLLRTYEPSASTVEGRDRLSEASRTQGDASKRRRQAARSVHTMCSPRNPVSTAMTSPLDSRSFP